MGHKLKISLSIRNGYTDEMGLIDRIHLHLREKYSHIAFTVNREETENIYYQGIYFKISVY
ncbi:hypothetical protein MSWH1_2381 [Methanosarcina sp. WH1]|nr:hypothetical protein MSWH1_2381 [Methanosarcina sp. WH1]